MVFGLKMKILTLAKYDFMERASQEEQNDANFSSIAPSSEELWVYKDKTPYLHNRDHSLRLLYSSLEGATKLKLGPFYSVPLGIRFA